MLSFLRSTPGLVLILVLLGLVVSVGSLALVQRNRWSDPAYLLKQGEEAIARKDWAKVDHLVSRLEVSRHSGYSHLLRGKEWVAKGDLQKAVEALRRVNDDDDAATPARLLEASCQFEQSSYANAEKVYAGLVAMQPENVEAHWGLAIVYFQIFAWKDSLRECEEVARLDDNDGRPHVQQGLIYKQLDELEKAKRCYHAGLKRKLSNRRRWEVQVELAEVLIAQHEIVAARELIDELDKDADPLDRIALQAQCDWEDGDKDSALTALKKGLMAAPRPRDGKELLRHNTLILILARWFIDKRESREALSVLLMVKKSVPNDPQANRLFLRALEEMKDPKLEEQVEDQRKAVEVTDKIYHELEEFARKAYEERTDKVSRREVAQRWSQLGNEFLAELWQDAAISAVR